MKLPWNKDDSAHVAESGAADDAAVDDYNADATGTPRHTPGKGRPTPSRREAENRRRGPVAPAPMTRREARQRRKETKPNLTKEQRREASSKRRSVAAERRELMMQGDERYLPVREKGPVKAFVRDLVDSRRYISTLFIPLALIVMVYMFVVIQNPVLSGLAMPILLVFVAIMAIEGFLVGRNINKKVYEKFPNTTEAGFRLGWYAFMRSTQLRRMRIPRPRVKPGDAV
ncbi:DUF3043 domain-containing protein [Tsukamurella sp. 8F]|uniref:DUF3043 domain-containing protein n=1 Tax=unclassified Tsukamurella TaxID=2633480 RepID=UPI0023B8FAFB|nr:MULTISPECIES: DUF3043 domain-containing protein [unclassified Tsukamurella]MDF0529911.1 DUF3043 domain-containing protein [Tsukamurella sp. 8J]MDF0587317.1 DUF3043 domain-containing protein [Tsukamurella sp. 8F]